MAEYDQPWNGWSTAKHYRAFMPKLCPKYGRDIKAYLKISNSIEILEALKTRILLWISFIICAFRFSAASCTRVKPEVQVLYRTPLNYIIITSPAKGHVCP
jgi:hypothetical protein